MGSWVALGSRLYPTSRCRATNLPAPKRLPRARERARCPCPILLARSLAIPGLGRPCLREQLLAARAGFARARNLGLPASKTRTKRAPDPRFLTVGHGHGHVHVYGGERLDTLCIEL